MELTIVLSVTAREMEAERAEKPINKLIFTVRLRIRRNSWYYLRFYVYVRRFSNFLLFMGMELQFLPSLFRL